MPGATATNIRKADLAEDLGRLLLRQFCAIASISKSDDFGIDTIATLLDVDTQNPLRELANKTFGIQFKAKSVREIHFLKEYEYKWLLNLDYPYLIGSVDITESSMEIYSIHLINSLPGINEVCKGLILSLDDVEIEDDVKNNYVLKLSLGHPIIKLSIKDVNISEKIKKKKEILKKWILGEYENIKVRNIGLTKIFNWTTDEFPQLQSVNKILTNGENLKIYGESFDFIDSVLTELKIFNESLELENGIKEINRLLLSKGIDLFLINGIDFNEFRNRIKHT